MTDWERIVAEHGDAVWRTAYRLVNDAADADDCMQEAFVAAVEVSRREAVRSWSGLLHRLVTAKALDRLRRRLRESSRRADPADWAMLAADGPAPGQRAQARELAARLRLALAELPRRQSQAFCLRVLSDMSYDQIAQGLGVSSNHVGVILHRARLKLRELLAKVSTREES